MKQHGPWKIKKSEVKYKSPWMEVVEDEVIQPDGTPGIYSVLKKGAGVSVLAIDDDGFTYLTREFKYALGIESLEAVSGFIDEGETNLQAAKRELREETGIKADELIDMGRVDPFTASFISPAYLFLAKKLHFSEATPDHTEIIERIKIPFDDAVQMVMESKITHGPSCVLILKANEYLRTHTNL
ncbi:MAG: NUDIX hydrolase [bacterium]|nr:NUDIX hydrolase [bacterium]